MRFTSKRPRKGLAAARSDGEARRSSILKAAAELFSDRGYEGTTTRAIAARAKCNVAAIKYYFGDKAGLLACVMEVMVGKVLEGGTHFVPDTAADPRDALRAWITWVLRTGRRRGHAGSIPARLMMQVMFSDDRAATKLAARLGEPVRHGILDLVDRLFDGKYEPSLREHAYVFVFSLCSQFAHGGPVLEKMGVAVPEDEHELAMLAERLTNFVIGGLHCLLEHGPARVGASRGAKS